MPSPKNGQVRAVPDDRTIRYYGTIGLLERPVLRGRTALYGSRHLAQVVAIKRLQGTGKSLAEIQAMWPQLSDEVLMSLSGVSLAGKGRAPARKEFWKREPVASSAPSMSDPGPAVMARPSPQLAPVELRVPIGPNIYVTIAMPDDGGAFSLSLADVRAIRAAAAPLVAELAHRQLTPHAGEEEP
ncbi:MAG: MerR family transcriptional regulator [Deltaproteobacteria bacterium]|nr:MerR family transcriptional regulator [Deltaproteobacteria bacterium]